jgi:DNA ligase (NAD+)
MQKLITLANDDPQAFANTVEKLTTNQLQQLIDKTDAAYYRVGSQAIIPDAQYDLLRPALRKRAPTDPRLDRVGCPYDPTELRTKVTHNIPMGSLDNTDEGILGYPDWINGIAEKIGEQPSVMVSLKVDGASIVADYKDGCLQRVATRGNGEIGEDITANAIAFQNLPTVLTQSVAVSVRGEAILYKKDFRNIREQEHGIPFDQIDPKLVSNPRNVGNGILGRDDGLNSNKIRFVAFNLVGIETANEQEKFSTLAQLGFYVVPHLVCPTSDVVHKFYNSTAEGRDQLPFEIDGIVVSLNDHQHQNKFITADPKSQLRPKYSRAIKFGTKTAQTVIKDVEISNGHSGAIIPTAILEEVRIGGVNVTHALLNNWDEIKRLNIAIGDEVIVGLAGDIIPKIYSKVPTKQRYKCPKCGFEGTKEEQEIHHSRRLLV